MSRHLSLLLLTICVAGSVEAQNVRRRATGQKPFPSCSMITGTAAVTFTRDEGETLTPSAETLSGVGYTYGLTVLDQPNALMAWHKNDLIQSTDGGCSWRVVQTFTDWDFPPRLAAGHGGRVYAWSDNRSYLIRFDSRGAVKLKQPVPFVGFGVQRSNSNIIRGGGDDGTIWQSTDGGDTWEQIGALRTSASPVIFYRFAFDPDDLDHIMAGTTLDGAYWTYDGGRIWRKSTGFGEGAINAFELVISPVDPDVVWAMALQMAQSDVPPAHGRYIYRSTDGGMTFTPVVAEGPGVKLVNGPTMAAHPADPDVLYFVFGTKTAGYGTDLFRYDAGSGVLSMTHSDHHGINSIAFSPIDSRLMYLGLEVESGIR